MVESTIAMTAATIAVYVRCYDRYYARCCAREEEDDAKAGLRFPGKLGPTVDAFLWWFGILLAVRTAAKRPAKCCIAPEDGPERPAIAIDLEL